MLWVQKVKVKAGLNVKQLKEIYSTQLEGHACGPDCVAKLAANHTCADGPFKCDISLHEWSRGRLPEIRKLWSGILFVDTAMRNPEPITPGELETLKGRLAQLGKLIKELCTEAAVQCHMHMITSHLPELLQQHGSIWGFANQGVEVTPPLLTLCSPSAHPLFTLYSPSARPLFILFSLCTA